MPTENLHINLVRVMEEKDISPKTLARFTGINVKAIQRFMSGEKIPCENNIQKLADALDVPIMELLKEVG